MNHSLFVSLDGPKGTGKTTLLEATTRVLRVEGHKVIRLSERNNDPQRAEVMALVNQLARHPDAALEWRVCELLAESRGRISRQVLPLQLPGSIILMDRWYPSDAAFRRGVPFSRILQLNIEHGVRVPDLLVAVVTDPKLSWMRAAKRSRGLGSTVIQRLEEHVAGSEAFERVAGEQGWALCRNDGTLEESTAQLVAGIGRVLAKR